MSRSPRLAHVILRGERNIRVGAGTLILHGLETLDIGVYIRPTLPMSWLPAFVERHPTLKVIKFSGHSSMWRRNPDILFPLQFMDAAERESLRQTVGLVAFSISPTRRASSLDDWPVVHLDMDITKGAGVSALRIASSKSPQVSSLVVRMSCFAEQPVRIEDLISAIGFFPALRRLELHCVYRHLTFEGQAPWPMPASSDNRKTSRSVEAHSALQWLSASVAQCALLLDAIHITDEGYDSLNGRLSHPWALEVTYQVRRNRAHLELHGTPKFVTAKRFRLADTPVSTIYRAPST
ncbi:hypothetical protein B0H13DRAFT_901523 [Mycena leptocephala]|nr:hypothetical protein B0H13DRAFT_901523 [Mycena leptocephala]